MPANLASIRDATEPTLRTRGWGRTAGPLWHAAGSVTCVDGAGSRLLRWHAGGQVSVARDNTGEGNRCPLDRQGRLLMCEGADHRRITRIEVDGTVTTIAERWHGKRFKKPNDVVCHADGSLLITGPAVRLASVLREIGFSGVYRSDPQGEVHLATAACDYPSGLAFSPDASRVSVASRRLDHRCCEEERQGAVCTHRRLRACDVAPDGSRSNHRIFCALSSADPGVSASLTADPVGRAFCVGSGGSWVIAPFGEGIRVMRTPEVVHRLACGGPDCRLLSLPPGGVLSTLDVTTPGIGPTLSGSI